MHIIQTAYPHNLSGQQSAAIKIDTLAMISIKNTHQQTISNIKPVSKFILRPAGVHHTTYPYTI